MHPRTLSRVACVALLAGAAASSPSAQTEIRSRWRPIKSADYSLINLGRTRTIVLKLADDTGGTIDGGRLVATARVDEIAVVAARLASEPDLAVRPLVEMDRVELAALRDAAQARSGQEMADLSSFFALDAAEGIDVRALVLDLLALEVVENAYVAPPPAVPATAPAEPSAASAPAPPAVPAAPLSQGFRYSAPTGVGAAWANQAYLSGEEPGGTGAGVTVLDVEFAWDIDLVSASSTEIVHPDLAVDEPPLPATDPYHTLGDPSDWWTWPDTSHGTASIGLTGGDHNDWGSEGIAPDSKLRCLAPFKVDATGTSEVYMLTNALAMVAMVLEAGDVCLLELQAYGPNSGPPGSWCLWGHGFVPIEYYDAEFHAIRQLTALGIHVVEPAGNGGQLLGSDDASGACPIGHSTYPSLFDPYERDSGAIMVGAATSALPHHRIKIGFPAGTGYESNWGWRVNTFAWGENVATLGPGSSLTTSFNGTSSASAIVAPSVALIESGYEARYGAPLDPVRLRTLVQTGGTLSADWFPTAGGTLTSESQIGRMINVHDALGAIEIDAGAALALTGGFDLAVPGVWPPIEFVPPVFGEACDFVGDYDGDGLPDVLVGAPNAAKACIYSGATGLRLRDVGTYTQFGEFGAAVAGLGDAGGDGTPDFAIGEPSDDNQEGKVSIFSGGTLIGVRDMNKYGRYGSALANVGDVNGDGVEDLAVGGPQYELTSSLEGIVEVLSGADATVIWARFGTGFFPFFGESVASVGDVDGDGISDVAIGAPYDSGAFTKAGRVIVCSGDDGATLYEIPGASASEYFGHRVAGVGDVDGDGVGDLAVLSWNRRLTLASGVDGALLGSTADAGYEVSAAGDWDGDGVPDVLVGDRDSSAFPGGVARVYSGTTLAVLETFEAAVDSQGLGASVAGGKDLDGDGSLDVLIGAPDHYTGGYAGRVYAILSGEDPTGPADPGPAMLVADPAYLEANLPIEFGHSQSQVQLSIPGAAGDDYFILGSWSGSEPGVVWSGFHLPVNPLKPSGAVDPIWKLTGIHAVHGQYPFTGFGGQLDAAGHATGTLGPFAPIDTPVPGLIQIEPFWVGQTFTFAAFAVQSGLVSNPIEVKVLEEPYF